MTQSYDVIIVGAGPGGGMAANELGQAGCRVLVLESERLPRYKPCAGGVPTNLFAWLPAACSQAVERRVRRVRFQLAAEGEVTHELPGAPMSTVRRERFDHLLLSQAQATVHDGERAVGIEDSRDTVTVRTSAGGSYRADYIIGADGAFSLAARAAGLRPGRTLGPALEAEVAVADDLLERYADTAVFLLGAVRNGYAWLFPKDDHLSVGVGAMEASGAEMRTRLRQVAQELGLPAGDLRPRGHGLPVYRRPEPLQRGRILLVGDAAGLLDPFSGEGIRHAVRSAGLASEAILAEEVDSYSRRVHEEIGQHLQAGLRLARFFYRFPRFCFRFGARNPHFIAGLLRTLNGELTYRDLIGRVPGYLLAGLRPQDAEHDL